MREQKLLEYQPKLGREMRKQVIKYPDGVVVEYKKMGRKIVGVINRTGESLNNEGYPFKYYADVFLDDAHVFSITGCGFGRCKLESILRAALYKLICNATHNMRMTQNRKAKKGGVK